MKHIKSKAGLLADKNFVDGDNVGWYKLPVNSLEAVAIGNLVGRLCGS